MHAAMRMMHGSSAPATPVAGYIGWWDATQIMGVSDGASLTNWHDLSGDGMDLNTTSSSRYPLFYKTTTANLIHGKPAVQYGPNSGSYSTLYYGGASATPQPWTVFAVVQLQTTPNSQNIFSGTTSILSVGTTTGGAWEVNNGFASGGTADLNPHVLTAIFNGNSTALYVDNTLTISATGATGSSDRPMLTGGGSLAELLFGEMIFYTTAFSSANRTSNYNYLKSKWGTP